MPQTPGEWFGTALFRVTWFVWTLAGLWVLIAAGRYLWTAARWYHG